MAIDQPEIIDGLGLDEENGTLVLRMEDTMDWDDPDQHLDLLEAKMNMYLSFIEEEGAVQHIPAAKGKPAIIEIIISYEPPAEGIHFLMHAREVAAPLQVDIIQRMAD